MNKEQLLDLHDKLCGKGITIMEKKNHDYTSGSSNPFANFEASEMLGVHPVLGILLRVQDKIMRIKSFVEKGTLKVDNEPVEDAIVDIINYMVLIAGIIESSTPKPDADTHINEHISSQNETVVGTYDESVIDYFVGPSGSSLGTVYDLLSAQEVCDPNKDWKPVERFLEDSETTIDTNGKRHSLEGFPVRQVWVSSENRFMWQPIDVISSVSK